MCDNSFYASEAFLIYVDSEQHVTQELRAIRGRDLSAVPKRLLECFETRRRGHVGVCEPHLKSLQGVEKRGLFIAFLREEITCA